MQLSIDLSLTGTVALSATAGEYDDWLTRQYSGGMIAYYPLGDSDAPYASLVSAAPGLTTFGTVTPGQTGIGDGKDSVLLGGNGRVQTLDDYFKTNLSGNVGSIAAWVKIPDWSDVASILFTEVPNTSYIGIEKNGDSITLTRRASGTYYSAFNGDISALETTDWVFISGSWDQPGGEMFLFFNGTQIASYDGAMDPLDWSTDITGDLNSRPGYAVGAGSSHYHAKVAIWSDRVIVASEFLSMYNHAGV